MNIAKRKDRASANTALDFSRAFSGFLDGFFSHEPAAGGFEFSEWNPKADIVEKEKEYVIAADIPGADEKGLSVEITDGVLTIRGERKYEHEDKGEGYSRIERSYGSFTRSFQLPDSVEADKIAASYDKGVLTVKVPKGKEKERKKIDVKVG